jgi:hypothetical protein
MDSERLQAAELFIYLLGHSKQFEVRAACAIEPLSALQPLNPETSAWSVRAPQND